MIYGSVIIYIVIQELCQRILIPSIILDYRITLHHDGCWQQRQHVGCEGVRVGCK